MTVALVLSGGGSKGDFELGAVRYLYEVRGIQPTLITGTSVGAINGTKLAEGEVSPDSGLRGLKRIWFSLDRNDDMWNYEAWVRNAPQEVRKYIDSVASTHLFSRRLPSLPSPLPKDNLDAGGLRDTLNAVTSFVWLIGAGITLGPTVTALTEAQSVANLNPIRDKIYGRQGSPAVLDTNLVRQWAAGGRRLRLASVSLDSGELRFITETGQLLDRNSQAVFDMKTHQMVNCDLREGVIASASIGMVFPPVKLGAEYYVDGGHRSVIPVDPLFNPNENITDAFLISASPIGLTQVSFENGRTLGNIALRSMMETFLAEIVQSEVQPRGGWGSRHVTTIAPSYEVHGMTTIDPGLIRINTDYGWMRADDAVRGFGPESRLFQLSNEITYHRTRIWFNEGRYLNSFGNVGLGEYPNLPSERIDLSRLIDERLRLEGSIPPGGERWAQIGEAHSVGRGASPSVNLWLTPGAHLATSLAPNGTPVLYALDSLIGDSRNRNQEFNDARQVVFSSRHQEPMVANLIPWRTAGRSRFPSSTSISCVQTADKITTLFGVDEDGKIVSSELTPDGMAFTGWLPLLNGAALPGGWVTGVSRRPGSQDIFVVGTDGAPYTAARQAGSPNWGGWWPLPAVSFPQGAKLPAVSRSADMLDVFGVDNSGNIITAAWAPGAPNWGGWWPISGGRTSPGGYVAPVSCDTNVIDLFTVGTDGNIYRTSWSPTSNGWQAWTSLAAAGLRFAVGAPISAVSRSRGSIDIAAVDSAGRVFTTTLAAPIRTFGGFTQIGARNFPANGSVELIVLTTGETHAYCIADDRIVYSAVRAAGQSAWSNWTALSGSMNNPVIVQPGDGSPFTDGMILHTNDTVDQIEVQVQENAVASDLSNSSWKQAPVSIGERRSILSKVPAQAQASG